MDNDERIELIEELVDLSRELQRIYSYLLGGQCIHAHRHACRMQGKMGKKSEPAGVLSSLVRNLHDGKQVQAEADVKKLGELLKVAHKEVLEELKDKPSDGETTTEPDQS